MSSLAVNFNQLVDLAVNPSLGTVNTILLHNLLHVFVNQLKLSTSIIEFHGEGSTAIENLIVNSQQHCDLRVNVFETREEIDKPNGKMVEKREEVDGMNSDETTKLFTIRNVKADSKRPAGHPLQPIHVLSTEELQKFHADSIHDVMANMIPSDDTIINAENPGESLRTLFDYINASKRLDALEIGIRQLADVFKRNQCKDAEKLDTMDGLKSVINPEIEALHKKIDESTLEMKKFRCECSAEGFEATLFANISGKILQELDDRFTTLKSEMENLKSFCQTAIQSIQGHMTQHNVSVCERLKCYESDLVKCMSEIQAMLDAKLDKFIVPELKQYIGDAIRAFDEKIEHVNCQKPLAAGVTKKIFKDFNCVSCGEDVIQVDTVNPFQPSLLKTEQTHHRVEANELRLLRLSTRLCGGRHTITTPIERIFRSENCQNGTNDTNVDYAHRSTLDTLS